MPTSLTRIRHYLDSLFAKREAAVIEQSMLPSEEEISPRLSGASQISAESVALRWNLVQRILEERAPTTSEPSAGNVGGAAALEDELLDPRTRDRMSVYSGNIENFIGTAELPVGLAGPLRVRGLFAHGDYYVPMATSEAALVVSYARGAQAISASGGCRALLVGEGVSRAPGFAFRDLVDAGKFVVWLSDQMDALREAAERTTRHGKLIDVSVHLEGNHVYLQFEYTTGDASGQNIVTIATHAACQYIVANSPVPPEYWFVEANLSGDKKASHLSFQHVRGRKVTAEVVLTAEVLEKRLHCTATRMLDYYRMSSIGGVMSGNIGLQGHYANGLAAVYIACGQDAACVAESAVGVTRFEPAQEGGLYASVTLPNVMVGTVGGGTTLPSARACLDLLGLAGAGKANAFAEVLTATVLAGELSIIAALVSDDFASAHQRLARGRNPSAPEAGA